MESQNLFERWVEDPAYKKLLKHIHEIKEQGKSIIMKKGVFDILHADHIRLFRAMKQMADHVVILTINDHNTSIIKPGRPIIPEDARLKVLSGIRYIDYVQTDYSSADIETGKYSKAVDAEKLRLLGVNRFVLTEKTKYDFNGYDLGETEIITIPEGNNFSTTSIINKIRSKV